MGNSPFIVMEPFINMFVAIDKDRNGYIEKHELEDYVRRNNLERQMVTKWQDLFDSKRTGRITVESFCERLGVRQAEIESAYKRAPQYSTPPQYGSNPDRFCDALRHWLEQRYGKTWHVVLSKGGGYWVRCGHLPGESYHFKMGDMCYSIWKTPGELIQSR